MDFHTDYTMTIGGEAVAGQATIEVVNPATGQAFATAPDCGRDQLDAAVVAARKAFKTWRKVPIEERQALVRKAGETLLAHAEELGRLFTQEQGRPVEAARQEIQGAGAWLPTNRDRVVSQALQAYAALTTSADRGAVRDLSQLKR